MPQKVFYAWQSDRDQNVCHYFIRDALKLAIKMIIKGTNAKLQESDRPELDHDRKNVSGTPRIAETIEKKIKAAAVFVGDMTAVADFQTNDGRVKQTPNANVMLELGMAFRSVKSERIILVMNTAFGGPDNLPFDLKDRSHPIQYDLKSDADAEYKDKLKKLAEQLAQHLKAALLYHQETVIADQFGKMQAVKSSIRQLADDRRREMELKYLDGGMNLTGGGPAFAMTLMPMESVQSTVSTDPIPWNNDFKPIGRTGWSHSIDGNSVLFHSSVQNPETNERRNQAFTEVFDDGFVFAVHDWMLRENHATWRKLNTDMQVSAEPTYITFANFEQLLLQSAQTYVGGLRRIGVKGDILIGLSLLACHKLIMYVDDRYYRHQLKKLADKQTAAPFIIWPANTPVLDQQTTATVLKPALDKLWRFGGLPSDPCFDEAGIFHVR